MGVTKVEYWPGATTSSGIYYFNTGYSWWQQFTYNPSVDPQKYGNCYGAIRRLVSGGAWSNSTNSGSRCIVGNSFPTRFDSDAAVRGCKGTHNQSYYPGSGTSSDLYQFGIGYNWLEITTFNSDADSKRYGYSYGYLRRNLSGCQWDYGSSYAGSRSIQCNASGVIIRGTMTARGCNKSRVLAWDASRQYTIQID